MELLFVALGGAIVGLAARYFLPGRDCHGAALVPAVGTAVASVVWVALTWLGWEWDGGWIWWVALVLSAAAAVTVDVLLHVRRAQGDRELQQRLTRTGVPHRA